MLTFSFFLALVALVFQCLYTPRIAILAFAPFLAISTLKTDLNRALWIAAFCGGLIDLLSEDPMGIHALNYVLIVAVLFRHRRHFYHDVPFHLCILTALFSLLSTLLQMGLLFLFDRRMPFSGKWVFSDLIGMPVIDALYAFVWFAAPILFAEKLRTIWTVFWLRKKNRSPISP